MIDIVIIILLLIGFFIGLKRGLILQVIRLVGYVLAYIVAYLYYKRLAAVLHTAIPYPLQEHADVPDWLKSTDVESMFYSVIAFILLFFVTKFAFSLLGQLLNMIAQIPILKQLNSLGGGVLGFVEVYIVLFIVILIGTLVPIQPLQSSLNASVLCQTIIDDTPVFSDKMKELWVQEDSV
jgi:uncharacterized membrane protein required for colicin V production